jgi:hypothetical protein
VDKPLPSETQPATEPDRTIEAAKRLLKRTALRRSLRLLEEARTIAAEPGTEGQI